jgi:anti-anti-sigma factor
MTDIHTRSSADRRELLDGRPPLPTGERRSQEVRDFQLRVERRSERDVILYLANELTTPNYYLLDEALERLLPMMPGLRVELEMSQVPYADSEALGRIIFWAKKFAQLGSTLVVLNPMPYVADVMDTLHFDAVVSIVSRHATPPPQC